MIADPGTEVVVSRCEQFDTGAVEATRIHSIAQNIARLMGTDELPPCRVQVSKLPPQHAGLGSGTQLSMAVAEAICRFCGIEWTPERLATEIADRGKRSAVGLHGYFHGGLVFESGSDRPDGCSFQRRVNLSPSWTVVIVRPRTPVATVSGEHETRQFDRLPPVDQATVTDLRHQIEQHILPAAEADDFRSFADAITKYNAASGELFRAVQGGCYNGPEVESVVRWFLQQGIRGVGQSSWGPGVFAWLENRQDAEQLVECLPETIEPIVITSAMNEGRQVET